MTPTLKKISLPEKFLIETQWSDGFKAIIKLETLRENCPCANCNEERAEKKPGFMSFETFKPGKFLLKKINVVGNYAISPVWEDGHDTGIYPFELLREIFEKYQLSESEIEKIKETTLKSKNN